MEVSDKFKELFVVISKLNNSFFQTKLIFNIQCALKCILGYFNRWF